MSQVLQFALLGLGPAAVYILLAQGTVLVYKGSGVVNFAQGGMAVLGAYVYANIQPATGDALAIAIAVLVGAVAGAAVQILIMHPMRRSSPLSRTVATLAVLAVIELGAQVRYGVNPVGVSGLLPTKAISLPGGIAVGEDRLWLIGIALFVSAALWIAYRSTRFGLATTAVAQTQIGTAAQGWSPFAVASWNWAFGGALGALGGALLAPIVGITPNVFALAVVPTLAVAMVGNFRSFPLTCVGGLVVGIAESEAARWINAPGWGDAVPFFVIMFVLLARGRSLPIRGYITDRLPRIGTGRVRPIPVVVVGLVVAGTLGLFTGNWSAAVTTSLIYSLLCLSLVVVTGYTGQISLAQFALAGMGAFFSGRLADAAGLPFPLAVLAGVVFTIPVGLLVALPALRTRGVNLAVATLAFATVIQSLVLGNPNYTGGVVRGTVIPDPKLFGLDINPAAHPSTYTLVCLVLFVGVVLMVANLRRGHTGRQLLAVRENERAAASLGVSVVGAKLYAFGFGAGIAALAGSLIVFRGTQVDYGQFDVLQSVQLLLLAVLGGIGWVVGAIIGGTLVTGGVWQTIIGDVVNLSTTWTFWLAIVLVIQLVFASDGIAPQMGLQVAAVQQRLGKLRVKRKVKASVEEPHDDALYVVPERSLEVRDLVVEFGATRALAGLSLTVLPGEVVGLIGPNGAGKTTLIDTVTGFVRPKSGTMLLQGSEIISLSPRKRAKAGLVRSWQSPELFEAMTVAENLAVGSEHRGPLSYLWDLFHPGKTVLGPAARAAVSHFGLSSILDRNTEELTYGERRLVSIARAVAMGPSVLLLDEPVAGLDEVQIGMMSVMIRQLAVDWGVAVLLVEHNVAMVMATCDRIVAVDFGTEIAAGTPKEVREHPTVIDAYLGTPPDPDKPTSMEWTHSSDKSAPLAEEIDVESR